MPWDQHPFIIGMLGGTVVLVGYVAIAAARHVASRKRDRHSTEVYYAPDGSCWFGADIATPRIAAENKRT